ncbi:hypothetical protein [Clostridium ganghwense]|uniref:Uncharacterized protein n=1 Tax=Clostridium ganghwense TaxID=312089 RepID=A0ABT4CV21_9CLOT|nr:hypothetical protein [Clostridium ganghwense]MCY6372071.1 hypothetical protein [Clostridium ganghwense]
MEYNILDILDKVIMISSKRIEVYLNIDYKGEDKEKFQLIDKVLIKSINRELKYYEDLKRELSNKELEKVNFATYDKISFLVHGFANKVRCDDINTIDKVLKCTLDLDKNILALYIDIQGRLIKSEGDSETKTYKTLYEIINEKRKIIKEIERILK